MPKATTPKTAARRHNPLADDVLTTGNMRTQPSKKSERRDQQSQDGQDGQGERFVDAKMSRKILQMGQELADEDSAGNAQRSEPSMRESAFEAREEEEDGMSDGEDLDEWGDEDDDEEEVEQVEVVRYLYLHRMTGGGNCY